MYPQPEIKVRFHRY